MATNTAVTSTQPTILSSPNEKGPYSIGFVYVNQSDVEVYVNGVKKSITTDYTFSSATQITFVANPTVSIEFRRNSDLTARSVDFNDGSVLTESDLDSNTNQILYAQQEIINDFATKTGTETLTNKTLTSPDINTPDIDGGTIDGATISSCTINNNVTGALTGNASTATTLQNARTIGGVSFDGSANINLAGVNTSGTQDTSGNAATATQLETARTIGGVSFNGTSNINLPGVNATGNQNTSGSAATLTTPRNINGTAFNGSADITITAAGNTLTGNTLASGVTASSLTSVGTLAGLTVDGDVIIDGASKDFSIRNGSGVEKFRVDSEDGDTTISGQLTVTGDIVGGGDLTLASNTLVIGNFSVYGNTALGNHNADTISPYGKFNLDLIPTSTNIDLGASSTRFGDIFGTTVDVTGNITVGGDIVTTSNGDIELDPNGSGKVIFKGNATKGAGQFVLNCENNSHGIVIKGPPHSAAASYTLTLPNDDGSANQVLKTDGSGVLSWVDQSGGGGSYANSDVDSHLNISGASSGQILSWNGSDYAWVADQTSSAGGANAIHLNDNVKLTFGDTTTPDLKIYHDTNHTFIEDSGVGDLYISSNKVRIRNAGVNQDMIIAEDGGPVSLYGYGSSSPKFETTSTGAKVTGDLEVTSKLGVGTSSPTQLLHVHSGASSGGLHLQSDGSTNYITSVQVADDFISGAAAGSLAIRSASGIYFSGNGGTNHLDISSTGNTTFGGAVSVASKTVSQTATAVAALEIDCATGNYFTKAITTSSTFTFSNVPASGTAYGFVLEVDCSNASTAITWPNHASDSNNQTVHWPGGTAPTLTDTKTHVFTFATVDGGTTWRASSLVDYTT